MSRSAFLWRHVRHRLAERVLDLGCWLWVEYEEPGPRCPDCGIAPDLGEAVACQMCEDLYLQQKAMEAMHL